MAKKQPVFEIGILEKPTCGKGDECSREENPDHWVSIELNEKDRQAWLLGLRWRKSKGSKRMPEWETAKTW